MGPSLSTAPTTSDDRASDYRGPVVPARLLVADLVALVALMPWAVGVRLAVGVPLAVGVRLAVGVPLAVDGVAAARVRLRVGVLVAARVALGARAAEAPAVLAASLATVPL